MDHVEKTETVRRGLQAKATDELVSILRNQDAEEWQPEVFELVASILTDRGVSPQDVLALGPEGYDVIEGQQLVTVARCFGPVEAHLQRMALREAGLDAWVADELLGASYGLGIGIRLQVRVEDEAAARAVLDSDPAPASAFPPDLAEPPCPACGSGQVTQVADLHSCEACGHAWSD
jgi:hypothetical protein